MKQIGNIKSLPAELKNPFNPDYVTDITIYTSKDLWGKWSAHGSVEFKKGNTSGKQKFEGTDLIDVLKKIYTFINNL
jgi:hypothetical protein